MRYTLTDGRVVTCDLATAEWRLDGFRTTEAKARDLLYQEMLRQGLVNVCAGCGSPRFLVLARPRPEPGLRPNLPPPPAARYCGACLRTMLGGPLALGAAR